MKAVLKIVMNLENGKTSTITIQNPRKDLAAADIEAFIQEAVDSKAFRVDGSPVAGVKKAYLQSVDSTSIIA